MSLENKPFLMVEPIPNDDVISEVIGQMGLSYAIMAMCVSHIGKGELIRLRLVQLICWLQMRRATQPPRCNFKKMNIHIHPIQVRKCPKPKNADVNSRFIDVQRLMMLNVNPGTMNWVLVSPFKKDARRWCVLSIPNTFTLKGIQCQNDAI